MRRIVCTADKGGVGKTTTVANVAVRLGELGNKVLVIDVDGQGDATYSLLGARPPLMEPGKRTHPSMYALMVEQAGFRDAVVKAPRYPNINVLPANKDLDRAPLLMANDPGGTTILKRALDSLSGDSYDFVLIDTAKGRDLLLINALAAANEVVVMVTPGTLEIDAVDRTIEHVEAVRTKTLLGSDNPRVSGILMTRADVRGDGSIETLTVSARRLLDDDHPGMLFETVIPEAVDYRRATSQAISIFEYGERRGGSSEDKPESRYTVRARKAAEAYERFVQEVLEYDRSKQK
jgi:chromosome partitioning protein